MSLKHGQDQAALLCACGGRGQQGAQRPGDTVGGTTGCFLPPEQGDRDGPGTHRGVSPTAHEDTGDHQRSL